MKYKTQITESDFIQLAKEFKQQIMKTQTAEGYFRNNYSSTYDENNYRICDLSDCISAMEEYTTTQIEALRERLINDSLQLVTVQKINSIVNEFLKEINDGKNID